MISTKEKMKKNKMPLSDLPDKKDHTRIEDFYNNTAKFRTAIMGLAMISVMLFHQYFTSVVPFNLFHNFGSWGVDVFLFLSGMGLVKSLNNNRLKVYYLRRLKRILPSCLLCGSIKYIIFILLGSSVAILKEALNIGIWSIMSFDLWFIPSILIMYAISPILYKLIKNWFYLSVLLIAIVFFINGIFIKPQIGYDWMSPLGIFAWTMSRLPVFMAGMHLAIKNYLSNKNLLFSYLFLVMAICFKILDKIDISFQGIHDCLLLALMIGMPALIMLNIKLLINLPTKILLFVNFFGKYSLELYLVHEFIFWILKILYKDICIWILLPVWLCLSCFIAYLCKNIINKIIS